MAKIKKNEIENSEVLARIASNVKYLRKEVLKLKQEEMELHGFNYRFFQDIESGKHSPTLKTLLKLSAIFKVDIEDLLSRDIHQAGKLKTKKTKLRKDLKLSFEGAFKILIGLDEFIVPVDFHVDQKESLKKIISLIPNEENLDLNFKNKLYTKKEVEAVLRDYFKSLGFKI
jgi:DNA-binding XRE family transcriptional regulator